MRARHSDTTSMLVSDFLLRLRMTGNSFCPGKDSLLLATLHLCATKSGKLNIQTRFEKITHPLLDIFQSSEYAERIRSLRHFG